MNHPSSTQETPPSPPMFTNAQLKALLLPLLLEQFLSVSMGLADTVMVSGVGEAAVSSVSLVDSLNVLIIQILSALATGGAVVASQYLGRKDKKNAQLSAAQLFSVLIILTVSFGLLCILLCRLILRTVFGSIEAHVMRYAEIYFYISAVSYPFIGLYNAGAALFRAKGDSKISMKASLVMNVVNIVGNAVLIYVFHLEVLGAAIATLIGRILAAIWVTAQLQRRDNSGRHRKWHVPNRQTAGQPSDQYPGNCLHRGFSCLQHLKFHDQHSRQCHQPGNDPDHRSLPGRQ